MAVHRYWITLFYTVGHQLTVRPHDKKHTYISSILRVVQSLIYGFRDFNYSKSRITAFNHLPET